MSTFAEEVAELLADCGDVRDRERVSRQLWEAYFRGQRAAQARLADAGRQNRHLALAFEHVRYDRISERYFLDTLDLEAAGVRHIVDQRIRS